MTTRTDLGGVVPATAENIRRAAECLRAGELVIVPTETVYGVAVRADFPGGMVRLFAAKGRDEGKPVAFFAETVEQVRNYLGLSMTVAEIAMRDGLTDFAAECNRP